MATKPKITGETSTTPKSGAGGDNKSAKDLDAIRKNLAQRSLHVKFDLDNTDYQPIEKIGIGAYGVVCSAIDKKTTNRVAIKKIPCVFEALAVAKRTYREIKILKHFKHDNIISIQEILKPKESYREFRDIYVVFDLMESDLHRIIYSEQPLTEEHIRYFLYQILRGLKYIHSANVVHRDLKPSNLLVNEDCHVRIGDFGMARGVNSRPEEATSYMTQYVATRWYRAPEILLSLIEYGTAVDMWSVGCIFAEMLGRKHLFPGKDYLTQVKLVLGLLGTPSEAVLNNCQNDVLRRIIKGLGHRQPMKWSTLFPKASRKALDLLGKMLMMNPAERMTVERALQHPFLSKYHDPDDEPICVPSFEFDFEKELMHMDREQLREVIYKEILEYHQPRTPTFSFMACLRPAPKADESVADRGGVEGSAAPSFKDQLQAMLSSASGAAKGKGDHAGSAVLASTESSVTPQLDATTAQDASPQRGEEVFKKPVDKPGTKKSPVSVDTVNLQQPCLSDIEMLSAHSTDGSKAMDTQQPCTPKTGKQDADKEAKTSERKPSENKTISEDTKALVKQALLNHRQRTESCGDDDKHRPVTAAQRQREREDKRKKKRDSKMKKLKEKKKSSPPVAELSSADKELLARWSSMQKKPEAPASQPNTTAQATSAAAPTIIYLQSGNSATPNPTQGNQVPSPPHPVPTSTPPTILPAGLITQGQVALVQGQLGVAQCQITTSQGQIVVPQTQIANLSLNQVGLGIQQGQPTLQGQVTIPQQLQQAGSRSSFNEGNVVPLGHIHRHSSAGQLCITETQAEALKEVLQLSPEGGRRESGGGSDTDGSRSVHTPPQASMPRTSSGDFVPVPQDAGQSPHHDTASPSLNQQQGSHDLQGFPPPSTDPNQHSEAAFSQPSGPQNQYHQPNLLQNQTVNGSSLAQHPQNLTEFLEMHYQSPVKTESSHEAELKACAASSSALFGNRPGIFTSAPMKEDQGGFESYGYFSGSRVKPEGALFSHKPSQGHQQQEAAEFSGDGSNHCAAANYQNTVFQAGVSSFAPQTQQVVGQIPQEAQSYYMPTDTSYSNPQQDMTSTVAGLPFSRLSSIDGSTPADLPFTRYTASEPNFHVVSEKERAMQGNFGMGGSHLVLPQGSVASLPNLTQGTTHPNLNQASVGSHPNAADASMGSHCTQGPQGSIGQGANQGLPPHNFGQQQQQLFHAPLPIHDQHCHQHHHLHHHHHHQHQQRPQPHPYIPDPLHPHLQGHEVEPPKHHPSSCRHEGKTAPNLRVSAPKQDEEVDLMAMLSSKLSSIFPPSLSLTPRGTGAGYGVGMDLDILMADTADSNSRMQELSPLSSSLLADWLDVSGNISQADLDALERDFGMTSPNPLAMSFNEFNPNSSNDDSASHWD